MAATYILTGPTRRRLASGVAAFLLFAHGGCVNRTGVTTGSQSSEPRASTPGDSPAGPTESRKAFDAWIVEDTRAVGPRSGPMPENEIYSAARGTARLSAAANETIAFQIVMSGTRRTSSPIDVRVSNLSGSGGTLDSSAVVALFRAQYVPIRRYESWFPEHTGLETTPRFYPDILVPWSAPRGGGPVALDGTRNEIVWVDIRVPTGTQPGVYSGTLELTPVRGREPLFRCTIELTVAPVEIPALRALPVVCRVDPTDLLVEHVRWDRAAAERARLLPDAPHHQAAVRVVREAMSQLQSHRVSPLLWGSFPKYRPTGERDVEVEWEPYDKLVADWISGAAFADGVGVARWLIPADLNHPDAALDGGFASPRYARMLSSYLAECGRHFARNGWFEKAVFRPVPPGELTPGFLEQMRRLAGIVRQSESNVRLVAHAPARSLSGLGWFNAPFVDLSADVRVWSPPAMWFEPEFMGQESALGREAWFMPDRPPYSASLSIEAPTTDARALAWQAYEARADGLWIEHAASFGPNPYEPDKAPGNVHEFLIYPGTQFGLVGQVLPSVRLKRLRRGLYDYDLLRLLDGYGKSLMARTIAGQIVLRTGAEAALDHLLDTRTEGWSQDPATFNLAREIILAELARTTAAGADRAEEQTANLARWARLMSAASRTTATMDGARLTMTDAGLSAKVFVSVSNAGAQPVSGEWLLASPPTGWTQTTRPRASVPQGGRAVDQFEIRLAGVGTNADGVYPFDLIFDTSLHGAFAVKGRLAVTGCPLVERAPRVDGDLSDWIVASNNAAGDFRLVRGRKAGSGGRDDVPAAPTQVYFCHDSSRLFVGVRCHTLKGESPVWEADNTVPVDGIMPWGQDTIEVLLCPTNASTGSSGDIFALQIKPNGVVSATRGCRTDPPIGPAEEWRSGASIRVMTGRDEWVVELSIPMEMLGRAASTNRIWGMNVTRLDARRGEYSSWSGAKRHCYSPRTMGNLIIARP